MKSACDLTRSLRFAGDNLFDVQSAQERFKLEIATFACLLQQGNREFFIDLEMNTKNVDLHYLRKRLEKPGSDPHYPPYHPVDLDWRRGLSTLPKK